MNWFYSNGSPVKTVVFPLVIITVYLNWATKTPGFYAKTGYGMRSSCSRHYFTPILAVNGYSNEFKLKQKDGYLSITSLKNCLLCLILRLYVLSKALL